MTLAVFFVVGDAEADAAFLGRLRRLQQPLDVLEEDADLVVMLGDLAGQLFVGGEHPAQPQVRMIATLTAVARLLRNTPESIATPCSVKA